MLVSSSLEVTAYDIIDPHVNFSDHLPLIGSFISHSTNSIRSTSAGPNERERMSPVQLRWNHADIYYYITTIRLNMEPILSRVADITSIFNENNLCKKLQFYQRLYG